jgi:hypothetical protein
MAYWVFWRALSGGKFGFVSPTPVFRSDIGVSCAGTDNVPSNASSPLPKCGFFIFLLSILSLTAKSVNLSFYAAIELSYFVAENLEKESINLRVSRETFFLGFGLGRQLPGVCDCEDVLTGGCEHIKKANLTARLWGCFT